MARPKASRIEAAGGTPPPARRYISLDDAAEYLAVSPLTVRRRIAAGELPAYRLGRSRTIRLDLADVEKMMRPIPVGGAAAC